MGTLIIIQTIFYLLASIAMVAVGILLCIAIYYLVCILRNTRNVAEDVSHTYNRTKKSINDIISSIMGKNKNHGEKKQ